MRKIYFAVSFLPFLIFSCRLFNNQADSGADNYIGYPVILGESSVKLLLPEAEQKIKGAAFKWQEAKGETVYQIQVSQVAAFEDSSLILNRIQNTTSLSLAGVFSSQTGWIEEESALLRELGSGNYFWRVRVKNAFTKDAWGVWTPPKPFTQDIKLVKMYWERETNPTPYLIQEYNFSYNLDGSYEKRNFISTYTQTGKIVNEETQVLEYNNERRLTREWVYTSDNCTLATLTSQYSYFYTKDSIGRVERRSKHQLTENNNSKLVEFDDFFYESTHSKAKVSQINRFRIDSVTNEPYLYFESKYKNGLQDKTTFYNKNPDTGKMEPVYYYDCIYHTEYADKMIKAVYYMRDGDGGFFFYKNYVLEYNFPKEDDPIIIITFNKNQTDTVVSSKTKQVFSSQQKRDISAVCLPIIE